MLYMYLDNRFFFTLQPPSVVNDHTQVIVSCSQTPGRPSPRGKPRGEWGCKEGR